MEKICSNCGAPLEHECKFCPECGHTTDDACDLHDFNKQIEDNSKINLLEETSNENIDVNDKNKMECDFDDVSNGDINECDENNIIIHENLAYSEDVYNGEHNTKKNRTLLSKDRKRNIIITAAIIIFAIIITCVFTNRAEPITGCFDIDTAQEFEVEGLKCFAPSGWVLRESKERDGFTEAYACRYDKNGEKVEAWLVVRYFGEFDSMDDCIKVAKEYYIDDSRAYTSIQVKGCSDARKISTYTVTDSKTSLCGRLLLCDSSFFIVHGEAEPKIFDESEYMKMFDACDTENYVKPEIVSISAEYDGDAIGGDWIQGENLSSSVTVTAHYNTGKEEIVEDWTCDDSIVLIAYGDNRMKIEYEGLSCDLKIECTDAICFDEYDSIPNFWVFDGKIKQNTELGSLAESYMSNSGVSKVYYFTIPSERSDTAFSNYQKALKAHGYEYMSEDGDVINYVNYDEELGLVISCDKSTKDANLDVVMICVIEI